MSYDQLMREIAHEDFELHRAAWAVVAKALAEARAELGKALDSIGEEDPVTARHHIEEALGNYAVLLHWREAVG